MVDIAGFGVMPSVLAEAHGLDACSQPCSNVAWQEVYHDTGLLVHVHECTQGCIEAGVLKLTFYLIVISRLLLLTSVAAPQPFHHLEAT